jgi:hypothetical protein
LLCSPNQAVHWKLGSVDHLHLHTLGGRFRGLKGMMGARYTTEGMWSISIDEVLMRLDKFGTVKNQPSKLLRESKVPEAQKGATEPPGFQPPVMKGNL